MDHVFQGEVEIIPAERESSKHQGAQFPGHHNQAPTLWRCLSEVIREVVEEVVVVWHLRKVDGVVVNLDGVV